MGRVLLGAAEDEARRRGYALVILDTGIRQVAAMGLYESAGYRRIPGFSMYRDNPGNRAYAKELGTGTVDQRPPL